MTRLQDPNSDEDTIVVKHPYESRIPSTSVYDNQCNAQAAPISKPEEVAAGDHSIKSAAAIAQIPAIPLKPKGVNIISSSLPSSRSVKASTMPNSTNSSSLSSVGSSSLSNLSRSPSPPPPTRASPNVRDTSSRPSSSPTRRRSLRNATRSSKDNEPKPTEQRSHRSAANPSRNSASQLAKKASRIEKASFQKRSPNGPSRRKTKTFDHTPSDRWRDLHYHQPDCETLCTCPCFTGNHDPLVRAPPHLSERVLAQLAQDAPLSDVRSEPPPLPLSLDNDAGERELAVGQSETDCEFKRERAEIVAQFKEMRARWRELHRREESSMKKVAAADVAGTVGSVGRSEDFALSFASGVPLSAPEADAVHGLVKLRDGGSERGNFTHE